MKKTEIIRDDGRYLIYYEFPNEDHPPDETETAGSPDPSPLTPDT